MGKFFKEYWLWIVAPLVLVTVAVGALYFLTEGDSSAPFVYSLF